MIADSARARLVSSFGWVDGGSLWACDTGSARVRRLRLGDFAHLLLFAGGEDHFAVQAVDEGGWTSLVAVHSFDAPSRPVAQLTLAGGEPHFHGDAGAWRHAPRAYTVRVAGVAALEPYALLVVEAGDGRPQVQLDRMDWFADGGYDAGWQQPLAPLEEPHTTRVTIPVQRDSQPVVYDWAERRVVGSVKLAGRLGNPRLVRRPGTNEVWGNDYDTLVRLEPRGGLLLGVGGFIGPCSFSSDGDVGVVPRPFSGDVAIVDGARFEQRGHAATGREPLEAALVGGRVFARDWRTGDLLTAPVAG